mmetsp:Transcript_7259/g.30937  ORF Transcript_7259/g.30937 Transcript_7259/m.30937 type:complete len:290 (+) Transcript_7259:33-902(+)
MPPASSQLCARRDFLRRAVELAVHVGAPVRDPRRLPPLTVLLEFLAHHRCERFGRLLDRVEVGKQLTRRKLLLRSHDGERFRGGQENVVADFFRVRQHRGVAERGEHVRVVRLRRIQGLPTERKRFERRPRRERDVSVGVRNRVRERALRFVRGVAQGHHDRPRVQIRHLFKNVLVERVRDRRDPDQSRRLQRLDRLDQRRLRREPVVRERNLVSLLLKVAAFVTRRRDQPFAVHEEAPSHRLFVRQPEPFLQAHRDQLAYTDARLAGAVEQERLIFQFRNVRQPRRAE